MLLETSLPLLLLLFYLLLITATLAIWFILTYRPARERPRRSRAPKAPDLNESQRPLPQTDPALGRRAAGKPLSTPSPRTVGDPFSAFRRSKRDDEI